MNHHVRNFLTQMTVVYIDWLSKESWLKHLMSTFFGAIETLFWDDKARSRLLKIPDRFKWYWITSWMGIKMVEYVAYLIYFHLPSEKRSSMIKEMIGYQTTNASIGNEYFFTKKCRHQTYVKLWTEPTKIGHIFSKKVL